MKNVLIPTSKAGACYLVSLYGKPPLQVPWSSSLRSQLMVGPLYSDYNLSSHHDFALSVLDSSIEVRVNNKLARYIDRTALHVGWHIHNTMMDAMCEWVRAHTRAHEKNTILGGIRDFFEAHYITVDIWDPDSAYKRYQRYKNKLQVVSADGYLPEVFGYTKAAIPLSNEEVEKVSVILYRRTGFLERSPSLNSLRAFVSGAFAKTSQVNIAKRIGVVQSTVSEAYSTLSRRYVREPAFSDLVLDAISDVRQSPCVLEPVLATSAYS